MNLEQYNADSASRKVEQINRVAQNITEQMGQTVQDHTSYGAFKYGNYEITQTQFLSSPKLRVTQEGQPSGKVNITEELEKEGRFLTSPDGKYLVTTPGEIIEEKVTVHGYHSKTHLDKTMIANMALESAKEAYSQSDYSIGKRVAKRYTRLLGGGIPSRNAALADLRKHFYSEDRTTAQNILQQNARQTHQNKVIQSSAAVSGGQKYTMADNSTIARATVDASLNKHGLRSNLSEGEVTRLLRHETLDGKKINLTPELRKILTQRQFQLRMDNTPKVNYVSGVKSGHSRVLDDYSNNVSQINSYLVSRGINAHSLTNYDIHKILKRGTVKGTGGGAIPIDADTRKILEEKLKLNQLSDKVKQARAGGGLKNMGRAWVQEGLEGTDAGDGIRNAKMMVTGAKAAETIARGSVGIVGMTGAKSLEATGRIAAKGAQGVSNLVLNTQRVFIRNDNAKLLNNAKAKQAVNAVFAGADSKIRILGHKGTAGAAWFAKTSGKQKVRYVASTIGGGTAKWKVVEKMSHKKKERQALIKDSKLGKGYSKVAGKMKAMTERMNLFKNRFNKVTAVLRSPFDAFNFVQMLTKKLLLGAALAFGGLCLMVVAVLTPILAVTSVLPLAFGNEKNVEEEVEDGDVEEEVEDDLIEEELTNYYRLGEKALVAMLDEQQKFLDEVAAHFNSSCSVHSTHTAYFQGYYGSSTDLYESLVLHNGASSSTYRTNSEEVRSYGIDTLYRTIISMATTATGNETEDEEFYVDYCVNLLRKILHDSSYIDVGETCVVSVYSTGLVDAMALDAVKIKCDISPRGCRETFDAADDDWMHSHGKNSSEYNVSWKSSKNYNEWKGWITEGQTNFEPVQNLFELTDEDWESFGIELPGSLGYTGGLPLKSDQISSYITKAQESLSADDSSSRISVIGQTLAEMNRLHVYSNIGDNIVSSGSNLPAQLNAVTFVHGVLQSTGIIPDDIAGTIQSLKRYPTSVVIRPGDILISQGPIVDNIDTTHVMFYLGCTEGGLPMTIECGGRIDNTITHRNGPISIHTYNSISDMLSTRGITDIKTPYGD